MIIWRNLNSRPTAPRGARLWRGGMLLVVLLLLAGCRGGVRHESWPGLTVVDGTLYAANLERVQALNAETGKVYWDFPVGNENDVGPFYSTPVLAPEVGEHGMLVIAGLKDQAVYGLALGATPAERPDQRWRFGEARGQYVGTGTLAGDRFVIGNGDGRVYALNVADGTLTWVFAARDRVWATPVVVEDTVYIASMDHWLYAVDLESGTELWRIETEAALAATPIHALDHLWIGNFASKLHQVDLATGEIVWTLDTADWVWATPVVDGDILYLADVGGSVYAIDLEARRLIWDLPEAVSGAVRARPALSPDGGLLFVASYEEGFIAAFDTASGTPQPTWATALQNPGRLPGDLTVDAERLYTMPIMVEERIQAFDLVTGELLWSSPESVAGE